jgi:hypothetical protein
MNKHTLFLQGALSIAGGMEGVSLCAIYTEATDFMPTIYLSLRAPVFFPSLSLIFSPL